MPLTLSWHGIKYEKSHALEEEKRQTREQRQARRNVQNFNKIFGLHIWAEPSDEHLIDIVFVHGPGGGGSTWAFPNGTFWPIDLLPKDVPTARILGFIYDAGYKDWLAGRSTSYETATSFLLQLAILRRQAVAQLPLIFVAHSMGGLVCESMLITAYASADKAVFDATIGIAFLGTPHLGSDLEGWSRLLQNLSRTSNPLSNSSLMSGLSLSAEKWAHIQLNFFELWRTQKQRSDQIVCFYEELPVLGIGLVRESRPGEAWYSNGRQIVKPHGAIIPSYRSVPLHANHLEMAKFSSSHDLGYKSILEVTRLWIEGVSRGVDSTFHHESLSAEQNLSKLPSAPAASSGSALYPQEDVTQEIDTVKQVNSATDSESMLEPTPEAILGDSVSHLLEQGRYQEAERTQRQLLESARLAYGPKDARTLVLEKNLGTIYYLRGLWPESESLLREVVRDSRESFGPAGQRTIDAMSSLAATLAAQGKFEEAEMNQKQVVETEMDRKGAEHPDTLREQTLYAQILSQLGRTAEASKLRSDILLVRKKTLGSDHPDTLQSEGQYALELMEQGRLEEARHIQQKVVSGFEACLGKDHLSTLRECGSLASILERIGQSRNGQIELREAARLQAEVLNSSTRVLGTEHPNTLKAMEQLAEIYWAQGRHDDAFALQKRAVRLSKGILGPAHPRTISSSETLARFDELDSEIRDSDAQSVTGLSPSQLGASVELSAIAIASPACD